MLRSSDRKKRNSRIVQRNKAGETKLSQSETAKQNDANKSQLDSYKEDTFCESGASMAHAKKILKAIPRNPEETPVDQLKCPYYHPTYCTLFCQKISIFPLYGMETRSNDERAAGLKVILVESVDREVKMNALLGMYFFN